MSLLTACFLAAVDFHFKAVLVLPIMVVLALAVINGVVVNDVIWSSVGAMIAVLLTWQDRSC